MNKVLCSTGALIGRPNNREVPLRGEKMRKLKFAVLIAQADGTYPRTMIKGIAKEAKCHNALVDIYTNLHSTDLHEKVYKGRLTCEKEIFADITYDHYDGVIVALGTFHYGDEFEKKICDDIQKRCHKPVVALDYDAKYFDKVMLDDSRTMREMVCHLNKVHGYTDIAYLSGPAKHSHAIMRYAGYKKGLEECGIPFDREKVYEGDFWYDSGREVAETMIRKGNLPQALVCANEMMAIAAYQTFLNNGIRIPEDMALTGFDALDDGVENEYRITSMIRDGEDVARKAVSLLMEKIMGEVCPRFPEKESELIIWDTCGCGEGKFSLMVKGTQDMLRPINNGRYQNFFSNYNYMMEAMFDSKSLEQVLCVISDNMLYLGEYCDFTLCLDEHWREKNDDVLSDVFCELYIDGRTDEAEILHKRCEDRTFLSKMHQQESWLQYFVPLQYMGIYFGYAAISFTKTTILPECFSGWIKNICVGLEAVRRAK